MPRTELEVVRDWVVFYRQSPLHYSMNALLAIYHDGGEKMLTLVLNELGLTASVDLVKDAVKGSWYDRTRKSSARKDEEHASGEDPQIL